MPLLKFSTAVLLILVQFIISSEQYQPCLRITKVKSNDDYTFALAQVDDYKNSLGPQEACYFSCGAQVVTQSSNKGDMAKLTLMDNAATFLTASGFLKVGESYYLNHLGMSDDEGGNGIGCIDVKPGNKINHYPKTHPVCSMAKAAVCGFYGQQIIPPQPSSVKPPATSSSKAQVVTSKSSASATSTPKPPPKPTSSPMNATITIKPPGTAQTTIRLTSTTVKVLPSSSSSTAPSSALEVTSATSSLAPSINVSLPSVAQESSNMVAHPSSTIISQVLSIQSSFVPDQTPSSSIDIPSVSAPPTPAAAVPNVPPVNTQPPPIRFKVNGRNFHIIGKFDSSLVAASVSCQQIQANIATITSDILQGVADTLKNVMPGKVIIGAWNGDNYSLSGSNCLILQASHGIFPGSCAEASAILCQS